MRVERETGGVRSSALWGRGGRGLPLTALAVLALAIPVGASAHNRARGIRDHTFVAASLLAKARHNPDAKVNVIIQSDAGTAGAKHAFGGVGVLHRKLSTLGAVAVRIPAARLQAIRKLKGLTVTPDAPVKLDSFVYSTQLWPYAQTFAPLWGNFTAAPQAPTIAVVDSGIDSNRADFGGRVVANVNLSTLPNNSPGDGNGHGTMVSGVAADSLLGRAGGAPNAKIVSLDVMDDTGMARTSDVIAAADWILANKDKYGIRVANFSLHSATPSNFTRDPLDQAVERLWFAGVVVVAASGNYAVDGQPSGVRSAPGNDPFVITVGATGVNGTLAAADDTVARWSSFGYTYDGFWKPELSATGRYMVGPVSPGAALYSERPDSVVAPGYMQLSGTSFSAPVVSAAAAQILARHPDFTPDQVKGALMATARRLPLDTVFAGGVGEVNAYRAAQLNAPPNPNAGLDRFVTASPVDGSKSFDTVSWEEAAKSDVGWDDVAWDDVAWQDSAWSLIAWGDVAWKDVAWQDVAWDDVAWEDVAWEDAASADGTTTADELDASQVGAAELGLQPTP